MRGLPSSSDYWDENVDRYYDDRENKFREQIEEWVCKYLSKYNNSDNKLSFSKFCEEFVTEDDLDFPDESIWMSREYEGLIGDLADQAYEEQRDREMFDDD